MDIEGLPAKVKKIAFSNGYAGSGALCFKVTLSVPLRIHDPLFLILQSAAPEFATTVRAIVDAREGGLPAVQEDRFKAEFTAKRLGHPMIHKVKFWELPENERPVTAKPILESTKSSLDTKVVCLLKPIEEGQSGDLPDVYLEFGWIFPCSMMPDVNGPLLDRLYELQVWVDSQSMQPELLPSGSTVGKRKVDKQQDLLPDETPIKKLGAAVNGEPEATEPEATRPLDTKDWTALDDERFDNFFDLLKSADVGLSALCTGLAEAKVDSKGMAPGMARRELAAVFVRHNDHAMTDDDVRTAIKALQDEVEGRKSAWAGVVAASEARRTEDGFSQRAIKRGWKDPEELLGVEKPIPDYATLERLLDGRGAKTLREIFQRVFKESTRKNKELLVGELAVTLRASLRSDAPSGWPASIPWDGWKQTELWAYVEALDPDELRSLYSEAIGGAPSESHSDNTISEALKAGMNAKWGSRLLGG